MKHRTTTQIMEPQQPDNHNGTAEGRLTRQLEADISAHIFSASAALVGVCLTVIGLVRIVIITNKVETLVDDFLAIDAIFFLLSCLLSYWALRTRGLNRMHRVEQVADIVFLVGLFLMVVACSFIAYAIW